MIKIIYKASFSILILFVISGCFFGGRASSRTGYSSDLNSTYSTSDASGSGIINDKKADGNSSNGNGGSNVIANTVNTNCNLGGYSCEWKLGSSGHQEGQLFGPMQIAVDKNGDIYVADDGNQRVQKFSSTGVLTINNKGNNEDDAEIHNPWGVAVDKDANYLYISDSMNRILKFTTSGVYVSQIGAASLGNHGLFYHQRHIAVDSLGDVYVADTDNNQIQKFNSSGVFVKKWGSYGTIVSPWGIAVDANDNVYITDGDCVTLDRVQKFDSNGNFIMKFGSHGAGDGQLHCGAGVAVDSSGNIYVADAGNFRIQKFSSTGAFIAKYGTLGSTDGQMYSAYGVAVDSSGNIYVSDG